MECEIAVERKTNVPPPGYIYTKMVRTTHTAITWWSFRCRARQNSSEENLWSWEESMRPASSHEKVHSGKTATVIMQRGRENSAHHIIVTTKKIPTHVVSMQTCRPSSRLYNTVDMKSASIAFPVIIRRDDQQWRQTREPDITHEPLLQPPSLCAAGALRCRHIRLFDPSKQRSCPNYGDATYKAMMCRLNDSCFFPHFLPCLLKALFEGHMTMFVSALKGTFSQWPVSFRNCCLFILLSKHGKIKVYQIRPDVNHWNLLSDLFNKKNN